MDNSSATGLTDENEDAKSGTMSSDSSLDEGANAAERCGYPRITQRLHNFIRTNATSSPSKSCACHWVKWPRWADEAATDL
ncbi:hypothetical protein HYALB_00005484 [Hymenoscyphus albidus]|uniref:Uncharacterized protein n=1 Tax=Hymenoscyphus albidus TaxID=595503 RepID=A0A9N9M442_9HELO|nr:hypothetical protein HYALB_00005484 [Hymenoscyphus albidus]